jgi:GMP synthase-like glutamine amidotransferase
MARILSVEHWQPVFAYNSEGYFARNGDEVRQSLIFAGEAPPDPRGFDLVIVYGGYMSAFDDSACPWISRELGFLEACLEAGTPLLGICLGSQLMARALGARVYKSDRPEFGFKTLELDAAGLADPALGGLGRAGGRFLAIQWHDDAWELPAGATLLASGPAWPNQAFRYGRSAVAIQFHLEFTQEHMASAVVDHGEPESADPEREDRAAFAAPSPRYDELRENMEIVLDGMLGRGARAAP